MKTIEDIKLLIRQCEDLERNIATGVHNLTVDELSLHAKIGTLALLAKQHMVLDQLYRDLGLRKTSGMCVEVVDFLKEMAEVCTAYDLVVDKEEYASALRDN